MRLKAISLIVAFYIALPFKVGAEESQFLSGDCRGPGGDGPKPMMKLPTFLSHIQPYSLDYGVLEGLYLPRTNRFAFRDELAQLKVTFLGTHQTQNYTRFGGGLSKVRDAQERYFCQEGQPRIFDSQRNMWFEYRNAYPGKVRPLFWNGHTNYSAVIGQDDKESYKASFRIQRYEAGGVRAHKVCAKNNFSLNSGYRLGEGHVYPYVVLHRTERVGNEGKKLTVSFFNVANCTIETKPYADLMKGDVLNVHYFAPLRSVLIETNHPTQQLVWDTGPDDKHCHYYSLNRSKLVMLSYDQPVIGAFDPYDGLSLIYMHDLNNNPPKTVQLSGDYPIADIRQNDLELSADRRSVVGITQLLDKSKTLIKIEIPTYDKIKP